MNGGSRSVIGEYDPCELDEDLANNISNGSATNGVSSALDSTASDSSVTTTTLPHDMDMETDTVSTAALKPIVIKQNGTSKTMSIVHSYNYTGKRECTPSDDDTRANSVQVSASGRPPKIVMTRLL